MAQEKNRITLGPGIADCCCHVCAVLQTPSDEYAVMLPFVKGGQTDGDRAAHIVDQNLTAERLRYLVKYRIDAKGARRSDTFELRPWEEARLRGGRFDREFVHGE